MPMHIDPFLFTDDAVSDETRAFNEALRSQLLRLPKTSELTPEHIRKERRAGRGLWGPVVHSERAREIQVPGPEGDITVRVIEADEPDGVYIHIHGGGWVLGAADLSDVGNEAMSDGANVTVASIDYRLAPEHKYPAGPDDCIAAAEWIVKHGKDEFGTDRLAIGGESAGANLAAATMIEVRDRTGFDEWKAANLVYGSYFPAGSPSVRQWKTDGLVLDSDTMQWFRNHYVEWPVPPAVMFEPRLAPLYGELAGLGSALFTVGTWDPLVDDTLFMASRWVAAGNETELNIVPGGVHAFDAFPTTIALDARDRMHRFVADRIRR